MATDKVKNSHCSCRTRRIAIKRPVRQNTASSTYHDQRNSLPRPQRRLYKTATVDDLREFYREIVFVRRVFLLDRRSNTGGRYRDVLPEIVFRSCDRGVHAEQFNILQHP